MAPLLMAFFMPAARLKGLVVPITPHSVAWGSEDGPTLFFLKIEMIKELGDISNGSPRTSDARLVL